MDDHPGLRERKKDTTRRQLSAAALTLFEAHGFEGASCAAIAEAANVSKKTLFNYFSLKADLVLEIARRPHVHEPADVVRARPPGQSPHAALRDHHLAGLAERRPSTGLTDDPDVLRLNRLIDVTPELAHREAQYHQDCLRLLVQALVDEGTPELVARLVAAQIHGTHRVLVTENTHRVMAGDPLDTIHADAVVATEHAYHLLEHGLGDLLRRS
ncbi:TetR/AcrR family transcriptional regulator [Actinokineospora globicatena]|uniref:TetR/AcrR family transcriptional regulator n=1 Tax=Actinokineospora globicatena TaxID=103729 RepID=UPI0020A3D26B|nr:TetR/AcrR family transcriptional regulator [Actinokineospora globicatena]MCP2302391.1 transcriptional regulator, TetR family [Actinokineospora globicatena]GLW75935.1 TetR family transcriptional regulator [Actinokineospora globicatena]GLW82775.1 TetR family transcriptional regulator [Actinokineospora globicatena]